MNSRIKFIIVFLLKNDSANTFNEAAAAWQVAIDEILTEKATELRAILHQRMSLIPKHKEPLASMVIEGISGPHEYKHEAGFKFLVAEAAKKTLSILKIKVAEIVFEVVEHEQINCAA